MKLQFELFYFDLVDVKDADNDLNPDTLLFHFYQYPQHAKGSVKCRSRMRIYGQLLEKADVQNPEGMGLKFVLRPPPFWPILYGVLIIVAGIGSGAIYSGITHQVETAFAVAGAVISASGVLGLITSLLSSRDII
jgi:hypothetical protein